MKKNVSKNELRRVWSRTQIEYIIVVGTKKTMSESHQEMKKQFYEAAREGNVPLLEKLLQKGARLNKVSNCGETPLYCAVMGGKLAAVRFLVEKGADKDKAEHGAFTPLSLAAYNGFTEIMQYLQQQGSLPVDDQGRTVLHSAAFGGQLLLTQHLVEQGADLETPDNYGRTALHCSVTFEHLAVAQYLVVQGANKDAADDSGCTPLHESARDGLLTFVRYLHQQGGDMEKVNTKGQTPLHLAAENDELEVMQYLLEEGGADRNKATTKTQDTALHIAAAAGHDEIVACLFTHLADLTARNRNGQLPIDVAKNDKIRQLITAEELRRREHGHKRAREESVLTPASEPPSKKQAVEKIGVDEEDQSSEVSDEEQT